MVKFKKVIIRELNGSERIKHKIVKKYCKPNALKFEDNLDEQIWEFTLEDCLLPFLKEEMREARKGEREKDVKYLFECPYCSFKSTFFYCVDLHTHFTEKCRKQSIANPCYPINKCIHIPTGKQFIP